jgi:YqaJ-like recombinase protein
MPKIHNCAQGEAEWMALRVGRVTASEMHNLVTPDWHIKTGDGPRTYLTKKLAEAYRGAPLPGFSSWSTEQGEELEEEARRWVSWEYGDKYKIQRVGFIEHDDGRCGCSPDALLNDDGGLELKCPEAHTHVGYLIDGELPAQYAAQVHMAMYVTQRPWWLFVSYRRKFPPFILRVERDEKICAVIAEALALFYGRFDAALAQLKAAA